MVANYLSLEEFRIFQCYMGTVVDVFFGMN
jgi:hypothetical protein